MKKPVFGVLTQTVTSEKKDFFQYDQYVIEIYDNIIKNTGGQVIPIKFDISEEDLNILLSKINGVIFTGGT